jgi:hypothetical protein
MNWTSCDGEMALPNFYHHGRILEDAQRSQKIPISLRSHRPDPVCRPAPFLAVLQITQPAILSPAPVSWPLDHHRSYHPSDLCLAHLFAIVAGIGRIESTQSLVHNGLIPSLLGLPNFPHRDPLRTFLWRFGPQARRGLQGAHNRVRAALFPPLGLLYSAIVNADTTAVLTYGHQVGTAVGHVPKRRQGKPSYAPLKI